MQAQKTQGNLPTREPGLRCWGLELRKCLWEVVDFWRGGPGEFPLSVGAAGELGCRVGALGHKWGGSVAVRAQDGGAEGDGRGRGTDLGG